MQVWDQVVISNTEHQYAGKAGLIVKADQASREAVLKLDEVAEPVIVAFDDLKFLGR